MTRPDRYKLQHYRVELPASLPSSPELVEHIQFLRSDHARFWYSNETGYRLSLPAVLLTDTGPGRGDMRGCYHRECDSGRAGRPAWADYTFLAQVSSTCHTHHNHITGHWLEFC